jgi:hypothetical protein
MPQNIQEGATATGPDGHKIVFRGGQWYPVSAAVPSYGTPAPDYQYKGPKAQADLTNTQATTDATLAKQPYVAPQAAADLSKTQTSTQADTAKLPYVAPQAAADAKKTQLEADKIAQDLKSGPTVQSPQLQKQAQVRGALGLLDNLDKQEALWRDKYVNNGPLDSMGRLFPTPTNRNFDQYSKNELVSGKAFLRVPGEGSSSDRDVTNYTDLLPQSDSYDATNINRFQNLRDSANKVLRDAGVPERQSNVLTPDGKVYVGPRDSQGRPAVGINPAAPGGGGGGTPPERPDGSAPIAGGTSGGNTMSLSPGDYTTKLVDPPATAKASFSLLMRGKPTDDQMRQWGQKFGYDVSPYIEARAKNPNVAPTLGKTVQRVPLNGFSGALNSVASNPFGAGMIGAADAVTGGFLDNMTSDPQQTRAVMDLSRDAHGPATTIGNIAGGTLAAYGGEAALGAGATRLGLTGAARFAPLAADTIYGAVNGAGNADDGNRLAGAALGGTLGAGGGVFGRGAARATGAGARGVRDASVQYLNQRGIPLTVGQAVSQSGLFGRAVKGAEDRLSGLPVIGDAINARRNEGLAAFNRTAFDDALAPVGGNTGGQIGAHGVDAANDAVDAGYRNALDGVAVSPDAQFATDLSGVVANGRNIPRTGPEFGHVYDSSIAPVINAPAGPMNGRQVQDILQTARRTDFGNDAMGNAANGTMGDVGGLVRGLVDRQAPGVVDNLRSADQAYRLSGIVRDAVNAGRNGSGGDIGTFTPAQLTNAAATNARRFGGSQGTTAQPFLDLTNAAQPVLPSKVPDSGTAGRLAMLSLPAALGGAGSGAGYAAGDTAEGGKYGLGLGAVLALGGTRAGQRILTQTLLDRPDFAVRLGDRLIRRQNLFGAPMVAASQQLLPR